jgi:hypothetical protein
VLLHAALRPWAGWSITMTAQPAALSASAMAVNCRPQPPQPWVISTRGAPAGAGQWYSVNEARSKGSDSIRTPAGGRMWRAASLLGTGVQNTRAAMRGAHPGARI